MSIAPATYSEVERRMDMAQWQKLMEREFGDGKRMGVYENVDKLAEGEKPFSCHIYKACSQVLFVDYRAHHPPPLSPRLWHLHSVVTPLDPSHPLSCNDNAYPAINNFMYAYQHLIMTLLFLQLCSQPDISFVVLILLQFCSLPLHHHYAIAHWILCYLKGTKHF